MRRGESMPEYTLIGKVIQVQPHWFGSIRLKARVSDAALGITRPIKVTIPRQQKAALLRLFGNPAEKKENLNVLIGKDIRVQIKQ